MNEAEEKTLCNRGRDQRTGSTSKSGRQLTTCCGKRVFWDMTSEKPEFGESELLLNLAVVIFLSAIVTSHRGCIHTRTGLESWDNLNLIADAASRDVTSLPNVCWWFQSSAVGSRGRGSGTHHGQDMRAAHNNIQVDRFCCYPQAGIKQKNFLRIKMCKPAAILFVERRDPAALTRLNLPHPDRHFPPRCSGCGRRGDGG